MALDDLVEVIKLNLKRQETWRYSGKVLRREAHGLRLEALFNREDMLFHGILLGKGDRFVEEYYDDRWYNIFEIHDREDGRLKGWYCNICLPAEIEAAEVRYVDLALDLLVYPDGRQLVLDEDEFAAEVMSDEMRAQALAAMQDLRALFRDRDGKLI
jgi:uncharacterized protein